MLYPTQLNPSPFLFLTFNNTLFPLLLSSHLLFLSCPAHLFFSLGFFLEMECCRQGDLFAGEENDDLFVDELLDFSHEFSEAEERPEEMGEKKVGKAAAASPASVSVSEEKVDDDDDDDDVDDNEGSDALLSSQNYLGSLPEAPGEGLESLEWLSHFVDDSFSEFSLTGKLPPNPPEKKPAEPENSKPGGFVSSQVQTKARTKRARTGIRVWPVLSPSFAADSTTTSSSSSSSSTTTPFNKTASAAAKKKQRAAEDSAAAAVHVPPRRCSHCGVTKTPQWRAGPMGSKTLCNACGVRFKSGRLLPEYRPACSPTFSSELHSNSHRKVLEMRRIKESEMEEEEAPSF